MRSLWRALAVAWLGGVASPMLSDDALAFDRVIEERAAPATRADAAPVASAARREAES